MQYINYMRGVRSALIDCLGLRPEETATIITDTKMFDMAQHFVSIAASIGTEVVLGVMLPRKQSGNEPPLQIAKMMEKTDVLVLLTSTSLSHTTARKVATDNGARAASMPALTADMLIEGAMTADFSEVSKISKKVADVVSKGKNIQVTTPAGTDIKFSIETRKWILDTGFLHEKGSFGNLPAGEVFIAPLEGTAKGTLAIDWLRQPLANPIICTVENGMVTNIDGDTSAEELKERLNGLKDKTVFNIAEFGIGTNKKARFISHPLEFEKVYGTVHIAIGDNHAIGGRTESPIHSDFIFSKPTVVIDGKTVFMENGKLNI